jgi:hypothetical protein
VITAYVNEHKEIFALCLGAPRSDATGAILTRLFGGFVPDFPHYISGKEFKK